MNKIFKSPNTQLVLQGIFGTLATIHPAYAPVIAILMGAVGTLLPGFIKPNDSPTDTFK